MSITTVGLDADDTLWQNEQYYKLTESHFRSLLSEFAEGEHVSERLLEAEKRNLAHYGFGIKGFTARERLVVDHRGRDAMLLREQQALGVGLVADHGGDAGAVALLPAALLGGLDDGGHVGAATRDQDDDVLWCNLGHAASVIKPLPNRTARC